MLVLVYQFADVIEACLGELDGGYERRRAFLSLDKRCNITSLCFAEIGSQ